MTSSEMKQKVLAIMFGDCHVDQNHNSGKARLDVYHQEENYDLLLYKKSILEQVNGVKVTIKGKDDFRNLKTKSHRKGYRLQTNFSRYFYKNYNAPFKFVGKQLVKPKALAILWQDDGTLMKKGSNFSSATLAVDAWEEWRIDNFRKAWNNFYGWSPIKFNYKCRGKEYYRLRLRKQEFLMLSEQIEPYCVDSMKYKVTLKTSGSN